MFRQNEGTGESLSTKPTLERFLSGVISHVIPECVLAVERLEAVVTLVNAISMGSHMAQQHETPGELLVACVALERFLSSVVSHMVVQNVSPVERLSAIGALELLLLHVCLDVPLQDLDLGELFLTEFTLERLDEALPLLLVLLLRVEGRPAVDELVLLIVPGLEGEGLHLLRLACQEDKSD